MWYWIALSSIPIAGLICGIIEGIYEKKHGIKKSSHGFWVTITLLGMILSCFDNKKK